MSRGFLCLLLCPLLVVAAAVSTTTTIKAIAAASGYSNSLVSSAAFAIASIGYGTGFTGSGMTLNGNATYSGSRLRLTDGGGDEASTAYFSTPVNIQSFTTDFTIQLTNPDADGMAFVIQNTGLTALGPSGGGLGYGPDTPGAAPGIGNSVALKFDLYDNAGEGQNSTGLYTNGASPTTPAVTITNVDLQSGNPISVQVTYDGTTLAMTLTDTVTGATFSNSWTINIPTTVGGNTAYVGFTGGTGGLTAIQDVLNWAFASTSVQSPTAPTVSVAISPASSSLQTGGTQQFTATVTGSTDTAVTWSVASGGGTVSTSGLYTAPSTVGTASVVATSAASPSSSALANVTIYAPVTVLLSASPTSVVFGSVPVGQSASQSVTLSNTGNSTVTIFSDSFTGSGFSISGLTFPFTLAAAASQSATLTFAPTSSGTAWGSVSFVSNATNSPATVTLSGSGTAPVQHTASLSWQPSGSDVAGYNVYRSSISGGPYARLNNTVDSIASYADSTVQSGQTYYYVVTALDGTGNESGYSSQVTAVIPSP
jgi:legume-like lectin family protein/ASPM-SPD-2-Hydin domain-containing protein